MSLNPDPRKSGGLSNSKFEQFQRRAIGSYKLNRLKLNLARTFLPARNSRFIFVFGCQRSGTTLLKNLIGLDAFINDAGEYGAEWFNEAEYGDPLWLRARPFDELRTALKADKSPIVLIKPLHDSQRVGDFLDAFPETPSIYCFRNYDGVIRSHLSFYRTNRGEKFGTRVHDPMEYTSGIHPDAPPTWKNENQPAELRDLIVRMWPKVETPADAYALFWIARNEIYFHQDIQETVLLLEYERLLKAPSETLAMLSKHIRHRIPSRNAKIVGSPETSNRVPLDLNPEILEACEKLWSRLSSAANTWIQKVSQ